MPTSRGNGTGPLGVPRKRAVKSEASRAASGDKYKMIFDSINDGVFIHDPDTGAILEANRKVTEMYGYTPDEIRAITIEDLSSGTAPILRKGPLGRSGLQSSRAGSSLNGTAGTRQVASSGSK